MNTPECYITRTLSRLIVRICLCVFLVLSKVEPVAQKFFCNIYLNCFAVWKWSTGKLLSGFLVTLLVEYVFGVCMTKECELLQWHPYTVAAGDNAQGSCKTLSSRCDKLAVATSGLHVIA